MCVYIEEQKSKESKYHKIVFCSSLFELNLVKQQPKTCDEAWKSLESKVKLRKLQFKKVKHNDTQTNNLLP